MSDIELKERIAHLEKALQTIADTADEEALMAPCGWDVGNSPESIADFALNALRGQS